MQNTTPKVGLIVHACDRYELLYKGFEYFFHQHWDFSIATNNYFATEEKSTKVKGFTNIKSGKGAWDDRLKILLEEKMEEEYILYLQEDMWFTKSIDGAFINQVIDYAIENKIDCLKLHSSEVYHTTPAGIDFHGLSLGKLDNEKSGFLMSHQITIWKKSFLISQLHKKEHPWRNERKATKRLKKLNPAIYQIDYFAENGKGEVNQNKRPETRSAYYTVSVNGMLGINYNQFVNKTFSDTASSDYFQKLNHNFANQVTHDGQAKPKKQDIFNKIKKSVKGIFKK
jgi:hypothetical protein